MKILYIAGVGGFAREVYQWAKDVQEVNPRWDKLVYLIKDLNNQNDNEIINKLNLPFDIEDNIDIEASEVICAIGDPKIKMSVYTKYNRLGMRITNIIHPTAVIGEDCVLGEGIIICPGSIITTNARIRDFVTINCLSSIGHDTIIGEGTTISSHCDVMGNAIIEKGVFLGGGSRILPGCRVEEYSTVGAGSIVLKGVKANTTVFGNPAKVIY